MTNINENFIQGDLAKELTTQAMESLWGSEFSELYSPYKQKGICEKCANFYACNEDGDQENSKKQIKNCFTAC